MMLSGQAITEILRTVAQQNGPLFVIWESAEQSFPDLSPALDSREIVRLVKVCNSAGYFVEYKLKEGGCEIRHLSARGQDRLAPGKIDRYRLFETAAVLLMDLLINLFG